MEVCVLYNTNRGKWLPVTVIYEVDVIRGEKLINALKKKYHLSNSMCDINVIGEIGNPMYVLFQYHMGSVLQGKVSPLAVSKSEDVLKTFYESSQSTTPYFVLPSLTFIIKTYEELAIQMARMQ